MKRSEIIFGIIRVPLDIAAVLGALLIAYRLREANIDLLPTLQLLQVSSTLPPIPYYISHFALPATATYVLIAAALRLYSLKTTLGPWHEMIRIFLASVLWMALIMAWFFLVQRQLFFSRIVLLHSAFFTTLFALTFRTALVLIQRQMLQRGIGVRRVLSCGTIPLPDVVRHEVSGDRRFCYLGHVMTNEDVAKKHASSPVDLVLHTDSTPASAAELIDYCRSRHIGYAFVPSILTALPHQLTVERLGLVPILRFAPTPLDGWGRVWKRVADLALGGLLLVITTPVLLITAILIIVTCGFPLFYVSRRVGQYGRGSIPLLKFRTMCADADARKHEFRHLSHRRDGPLFKIKNDPRVTNIGRVLRRCSIDELPQLLNVVAGHLSLVGPRPHLPEEVARYRDPDRRVFVVRPGVTGLSQISGRSDLTFEEEVTLDMRYIEEWSLGLDLWILWRTFFVVVFGRGAD